MAYNLASLGGVDIQDNPSEPVFGMLDAVELISKFIAADVADIIRSEGVSVTDALAQSIEALAVEFDKTTASFDIVGLDYYKFINEGVDGVEIKHGSPYSFKTIKPPSFEGIDSIMTWLETKVGGQVDMSHAYAVGVNIKKKGIKPKKLTDTILATGLIDRIEEAVNDTVDKVIFNTIK